MAGRPTDGTVEGVVVASGVRAREPAGGIEPIGAATSDRLWGRASGLRGWGFRCETVVSLGPWGRGLRVPHGHDRRVGGLVVRHAQISSLKFALTPETSGFSV